MRNVYVESFFTGEVRESKWGGFVWGSKNRYSQKLYSTLENYTAIQRISSQGIVSRDFPIFEGMKKFYYRFSAKKCIKYSFDSRAHLKTERCLCFPTSDCLETWLIPSAPAWSRQYHKSTMVWPNLKIIKTISTTKRNMCHRFLYFVLLFSTKTAWQRGNKYYQRFYESNFVRPWLTCGMV